MQWLVHVGIQSLAPSPKLRATWKAYSIFKVIHGLRPSWAEAWLLSRTTIFPPLLPQVLIPRTVLNIPCTKLHLRVSFLRNLINRSDKVFHLVNAYINVSFYNLASHTKANIIDVPMHAFHPIQTFHQYRSFSQIKKLSSILVLVTTVSNEQGEWGKYVALIILVHITMAP